MLLCGILANAQNTRLKDHNRIGWWTGFVNIKLTAKWSAHGEYQWRREQFVTHWQQSLLRVGLSWQVRPEIQLRSGYAWAETFNYGDYPINGFGKDFTEHRFFEMITLSDKHGRLELSQRFMLVFGPLSSVFDFLTFDEAARLLQAAQAEPEWYTMIIVGLRAGLRQGELLELRWDDLDLTGDAPVVVRLGKGSVDGIA